MFGNKYPYTDIHELNLDWIITKVQQLDNYVNNEIHDIIREDLDKLFIDSAYDAATETLILVLKNPEN